MEVLRRLILLTHIAPGLTYWTIWDLPLSVMRAYLSFADDWIEQKGRR